MPQTHSRQFKQSRAFWEMKPCRSKQAEPARQLRFNQWTTIRDQVPQNLVSPQHFLTVRVPACARKFNVGTIQACVMLVLLNIYIRVTALTRCACVRACLVAAVVFVPRVGAPPPEFDGRGAQQVLDAAPDRAASLRRHRVVSLSASCFSHRPRPVFVSSDSRLAAAVMLPAWFRLCTGWVDGLRFCRCCTASQTCAAVKRRSGLNTKRSGMTAWRISVSCRAAVT